MKTYTPHQVEELKKCAADFCYFTKNYVKIIHPIDGLIPFELYEFQKRVISDYDKFPFNIVKKFRQAGLTTVSVTWALWRCLFRLDQRIMVLTKADREARGIGKIVQNIKMNLPDWMQPEMLNDNDHEKEFADTGGVMWFFTAAGARSRALTYLIIDEAAFIPNMDEAWKSMYPTLATGGRCIVISTVNGIGNWYEETYTKAEDSRNQFHIINLDYHEHPDYCKPEWEARNRANLGEKAWLQEICGHFLGSGETYINSKTISELSNLCLDPVDKMFPEWDTMTMDEMSEEDLKNDNYQRGAMWLWKEPQPGREYLVSADCSEGVGADNSAFHVIDMHSYEQVAEFYSNSIPVHKFSQVLAQVATFYNEATLVMDHDTGPGLAVVNRLEHTIHYPNLYYEMTKNRGDKAGITVNKTNRPIIMETFQTCLLNKLVRVRSRRLIRELKTFVHNKSRQRPEAIKGKNDDLILAMSYGLHILDISNRDLPVGTEASTSRITQAIIGKSYEEIRKHLEDGLPDDFFDTEEEIEYAELLPNIMFDKPKRPNERILKEFGW